MAINSRKKGAKNERKIADLFTKWTGRKFAKTPASGGLQWKSSFSKGDIVCTKEGHYFPFCLECKAYVKIDFSHLLNPQILNVDILDFWTQCKRDADACNKVPLLFMRYNGLPKDFYFVVMSLSFANSIVKLGYIFKTSMGYKGRGVMLMIVTSTDFFKMDYKLVKDNAKDFKAQKKIKKGN